MVTGSKELIRDINSTLVLETVIHQAPVSRAEIAKCLGLTKATVSAIVEDLLNQSLILEAGSKATIQGRKPILLEYHANAGYAICVDIGVNFLHAIRTNLKGEKEIYLQEKALEDLKDLKAQLIKLISKLIASAPKTVYGLVGIAVGIHGVVKENEIMFTPYYDLSSLDLANVLRSTFDTPVLLENEANLSVLGEKGFVYDVPNIVGLSIHAGIGLGIVIEHKLYTGSFGYAGEIGHTILQPNGRLCPCGNRGCLEQYLSERALLQEYAKRKGKKSITSDEFFEDYLQKDKDAIEITEEFVTYMTICINNVIVMYNPDIVVINSVFVACLPSLIKRIEQSLTSQMNRHKRIVPSGLQDASILLGGIWLCIKQFLGVNQLHLPKYPGRME